MGDELVVEWRALTVALLDELAPLVRARLRRDADECRWPACWKAARGPRAARWRSDCAAAFRPCPSSATARSSRPGWARVHLIDHPLVQHKLTLMRRKERLHQQLSPAAARDLGADGLRGAARHADARRSRSRHRWRRTTGRVIDGKKLVFVSILRAGTGILDGMLTVVPGARVGHIGLYRDPKTLVAVEYYFKMPGDLHERDVVVVDPMLATGNSAVAAVDRLKDAAPSRSSSSAC